MAPAVLLYELGLHGVGWHIEQQPDATADGWGMSRDVQPVQGEDRAAKSGADSVHQRPPMPSAVAAAISAVRRGDVSSLTQLIWAHPRLSLPAALLGNTALLLWGRGLTCSQQKMFADQPEWQLTLCATGEILAVWRHHELCLLSPRDNYAQPVALWHSPADPQPQRRLLAWNVDDTLLAACTSDGTVHVLDARCRLLHTLAPRVWHGLSDSDSRAPSPLIAVAWRQPAGRQSIASELLLLCADAVLRRVLIPSAATAAVHGTRPTPSPSKALDLHAQVRAHV